VEVYAYGCRVEPERVDITGPLPVHLAAP
jgi:hypothetical protein